MPDIDFDNFYTGTVDKKPDGEYASTGGRVELSNEPQGSTHVADYIYGGYNTNGNAVNNWVTINGGEADKVYGGASSKGDVYENQVKVYGKAEISDIYGGETTSGEASNNKVNS